MGGCRCFFRDCKVNTYKNPLMHFFRFPIKDAVRFQQWREYCKQQQIVEYPPSKQKNIVICSRHFRDECFMNYKKDRLVATAVPTIHRLSTDKALDYKLDMENGVLVTLPKPKQEHLIPPLDFECPLGLDVDEALWVKLRNIEKGNCGDYSNNETGVPTNRFLIEQVVEHSSSNASQGTIDMESSQKRPLGQERHDRVYSPIKKIKTLNHTQRLTTPTDAEHISIPIGTTMVLDNLENSNPTIINHQIIEAEDMWIEQESYNIADNGADYELVEIQSIEEQNDVPPVESEKSLPPPENEDEVPLGDICTSEQCQANCLEMENTNTELIEENIKLDRKLSLSQKENNRIEKRINALMSEVEVLKNENEILKTQLEDAQTSSDRENLLRQNYEQQLQNEQSKHTEIEDTLQQQIVTLEHSLESVRQQLADTKNSLSGAKKDYASVQSEKMNLIKQQVETDHKLQNLQELYDNLNIEHSTLQNNHEILQKTHTKLREDFTKLESQQNQVSTVTTSNSSAKADAIHVGVHQPQHTSTAVVGSLTKAQLFNGIKRYVSSSMVALLRMEMFGSSDREWKPDERQAAVDLLRLGETVYTYFTDEWRFRLPGLRDVRNWLSQNVDMNDEEDL